MEAFDVDAASPEEAEAFVTDDEDVFCSPDEVELVASELLPPKPFDVVPDEDSEDEVPEPELPDVDSWTFSKFTTIDAPDSASPSITELLEPAIGAVSIALRTGERTILPPDADVAAVFGTETFTGTYADPLAGNDTLAGTWTSSEPDPSLLRVSFVDMSLSDISVHVITFHSPGLSSVSRCCDGWTTASPGEIRRDDEMKSETRTTKMRDSALTMRLPCIQMRFFGK